MNSFNHYFDAAFALGLERLTRGRRPFTHQVLDAGIDFEFVEGIDTSVLKVSTITGEIQTQGRTLQPPSPLASSFPGRTTQCRTMNERPLGPGEALTPGASCNGVEYVRAVDEIVAGGACRALIRGSKAVLAGVSAPGNDRPAFLGNATGQRPHR